MRNTVIAGVCVALSLASGRADAQIAVSSNDHKVTQENGVTRNILHPQPDSVTVVDLAVLPVKVVGVIPNVPGSVVGPPLSVAVTPDESLALVASSTQIDPGDRSKTIPDDRVTVIDLKTNKVIDTVKTGPGAAGISIAKDGKRAYVCNRMAGSISILSIDGRAVRVLKSIGLAEPKALVSHIALSPDGKTGVVTRNGDGKVVVVKLAGDSIAETGTLDVAPRPYAAAVTPDGRTAVVASLGDPKGNGVLTVIDIARDSAGKIVGTTDIGYESLEGMMMSADGRWIAAVAHAGSTRPKDAPQYRPNSMVVIYRLDGNKLTKTSEAPIGAWAQGAAFSRDGTIVVAQSMIDQNIRVFRNIDGKLTDTGQRIETSGGAAAIRASTGP
jgi:YVTN family beta-propeller protein